MFSWTHVIQLTEPLGQVSYQKHLKSENLLTNRVLL